MILLLGGGTLLSVDWGGRWVQHEEEGSNLCDTPQCVGQVLKVSKVVLVGKRFKELEEF